MAYDIPPLRFPMHALEPHVTQAALKHHHEVIHRGYLDALNALIAAHPEIDRETVEDLLRGIDEVPTALRQQAAHLAGGHANHQFLWKILGPQTCSSPDAPVPMGSPASPVGGLATAIDAAYGSFDGFRSAFTEAALSLPTEGWAFLSLSEPRTGDLEIVVLPGNGSVLPIAKPGILICDLWDNMGHPTRADWLDAFWHIVDWEVGEYRYQGLRDGRSLL